MTAVVEAQTAISSSIGNGTGNAAAAIAGANGATGSKLHGYAFYESIGRPKFVIAPMVDQSELVSLIL
jgi:tRNA-dihydrouridine synthase 1